MYEQDERGVLYWTVNDEWDAVPHCSGRSSTSLSNISAMISEFKELNTEGKLVLYSYPNGDKDLFYHQDCLGNMRFAEAVESMECDYPSLDDDLAARLLEDMIEEAWHSWVSSDVATDIDEDGMVHISYEEFRAALAACQSNGSCEVIEESDGVCFTDLGPVVTKLIEARPWSALLQIMGEYIPFCKHMRPATARLLAQDLVNSDNPADLLFRNALGEKYVQPERVIELTSIDEDSEEAWDV